MSKSKFRPKDWVYSTLDVNTNIFSAEVKTLFKIERNWYKTILDRISERLKEQEIEANSDEGKGLMQKALQEGTNSKKRIGKSIINKVRVYFPEAFSKKD